MIKRIVLIIVIISSSLQAADRFVETNNKVEGQPRQIFKLYPHLNHAQLRDTIIYAPHAVDQDLLKCSCQDFEIPYIDCLLFKKKLRITKRQQPADAATVLWDRGIAYFQIEAQNKRIFANTNVEADHWHGYLPGEYMLPDNYKMPPNFGPGTPLRAPKVAAALMTPYFAITKTKLSLTPLSKGLIAATAIGTAVGLGMYLHTRLQTKDKHQKLPMSK